MTLSNWDTLSIDQNGKPTNGIFKSPLGIRVAIYKNWLYIHDNKAYEKGGLYVEPIVMEIQEGDLIYKDISIFAKRGPQSGIFCVVYVPTWAHEGEFIAMIGAGVCGFEDEKWIGVNSESLDFLKNMVAGDEIPDELKNIDLSGALRFNQGHGYSYHRNWESRIHYDVSNT